MKVRRQRLSFQCYLAWLEQPRLAPEDLRGFFVIDESDDWVRLRHMLDAARMAVAFVSARDGGGSSYQPIELLGLEKLVENIGEASSRLSSATRDRMPQLAWKQMIGMRHVLVHDYFDVDDTVVLDTVRVYLPSLIQELERVLDENGA